MTDADIATTARVTIDQVVAFELAAQRYALPIDMVQEIQQIVAFSEVPSSFGATVGMVNLRGSVIPAVDLRQMVGLPRIDYSLDTPMIICRTASSEGLVALMVDSVEDVLAIPPDSIQPIPQMHALSDRMIGVARLDEGLVYILDLNLLMSRGV